MKKCLIYRTCQLSVLALAIAGASLSGFSSTGVESVSTNLLTLDEAIRLAFENNPNLRASGARVDAATGRAYQAGKWSNPELELNVEEWPVSGGRGFSDAKQTIGVVQTLPYPGKKSLDKKIGGAGIKLTEAGLTLRRTELVRDVKASFFQVLAAEQLVEVSSQLVAVAESSAVTAGKRVDAGAAAYQEQLRAEVQLDQAQTELRDFQRELAAARQIFATVVGRPDLSNAQLSGALAVTADSSLMEADADDALARHPSAATAQANLDRANLEHRRARLEPYPDVKVGVAGGRLGETEESIIELGFSIPLPILDRGKGRQQETLANVSVAEAEFRAVRLQLQREWANSLERCRSAVEQVTDYRERILPKAEEALRLVQTGFEEGKFNFIDLLDTQRTAAEARLAYQQRLLQMNIAHAELEALLHPQSYEGSTSTKNSP